MTSPLTTTAAAATALLTSPMVTESVVEEFAGSSPQNEIAAETTDDLPRSLSGARTRYELPDAKAPVHIISQGEAMADLVALKTRIRNIDHFARENPRSRQDYRYLPQAITDALIADLRQSPAYEDLASHSPEPDQNHTGIFPDADTLLAVAGTDLNNSFHTSPAFQYFTKLGKVATNLREQAYQHWKTEAFGSNKRAYHRRGLRTNTVPTEPQRQKKETPYLESGFIDREAIMRDYFESVLDGDQGAIDFGLRMIGRSELQPHSGSARKLLKSIARSETDPKQGFTMGKIRFLAEQTLLKFISRLSNEDLDNIVAGNHSFKVLRSKLPSLQSYESIDDLIGLAHSGGSLVDHEVTLPGHETRRVVDLQPRGATSWHHDSVAAMHDTRESF